MSDNKSTYFFNIEKIAQLESHLDALQSQIDIVRGALTDIALSDDMTLKIARAKAKRIYDSTAPATGEKS